MGYTNTKRDESIDFHLFFYVDNVTYSSFCRLKSSLHSIFTHVSRIQYTFSTKLMV
ncbi:hypothetical protein HMPREF0971_01085 [Segatella oris F0302]|uniref:Uncharacterized protein n=1 Tax=Segatella oris F0302 TaxID=649760 RepID=D1QQ38_9BACT|nr:hypothetical protein HMPREF0971_01085 [Segatella oris F0302]